MMGLYNFSVFFFFFYFSLHTNTRFLETMIETMEV